MKRKRWFAAIGLIVAIAAISPAYVRVYVVAGPSDAPSFLVGDRVLALKAAYDMRLPYTDIVIASHAEPRRGDVVM
jgi:signal peptidase I